MALVQDNILSYLAFLDLVKIYGHPIPEVKIGCD